MEAIESSQYMHQPTLDKHYLGFHPQPPDNNTPSFPSEHSLQNPPHNPPNAEENDADDEVALQSIVEDLQNLVLNQASCEGNGREDESVKAKSVNEDEIAVQIIVEEVRNLVLKQALSEDRAKGVVHEGNGRDGIRNESVKEASETEYRGDHYEDGDHSWSEYGNVIDVENEKGGEEGLKEWGFNSYEDGDDGWRGNGDVIDVENEKGGEAGSKEWGFSHYEDGGDCWRGNGYVIDVENEKGGEAGSKEWGFNANGRRLIHPLRPDAVDCAYYMKTGTCQYGVNCKFNHPSRTRNQQWAMEKGKKKEESGERAGLIECKVMKFIIVKSMTDKENLCFFYA